MKILSTVIFTLLFAFSVYAQTQAEVIVPNTFLRKAPNASSEKVQTVQKGDKVSFEKPEANNGWYYVSIPGGKIKGWINENTIRRIESAGTAEATPTAEAPPSTPKPTPTPKQTPTSKPSPTLTPSPTASVPETVASPSATPSVAATKPDETVSAAATPTASPTPIVTPTPKPTPAAPVEDNEVLKIDAEEVSLNVRVVDGNNRPVGNLKQSNFEVYEDDVLQPITSLTTAEVPTINALVIDNSRSLRSQLSKIIEAGKIIVGTNRPKDESTVVRFVSADKIEVLQDFTPNKALLDNALNNLFVEGGQTAIIDAVYRTAQKVEQYQNTQKKEDIKLRSLILVSDGDDRSSTYKEEQLVQLLRESQVQVYAIGFISGLSNDPDESGKSRQDKAKAFMTRLAQETGGKVYFPNSIDELPRIATEISGELRTQYLISYVPTNEVRDGSFHRIRVSVTDGANKEKRNAITRTGRTAAPKE